MKYAQNGFNFYRVFSSKYQKKDESSKNTCFYFSLLASKAGSKASWPSQRVARLGQFYFKLLFNLKTLGDLGHAILPLTLKHKVAKGVLKCTGR